ncbi:hypothetical protein D3C72_1786810 [compost metagenome]
MHQQAFLHRRQREDVIDVAYRDRQSVELLLAERGQGEVRRRQAQMRAAAAVFDQLLQRLAAVLCQLLNLGLGEHLLAEVPGHVQAVVVDLAVDRQPIAQWGIGAPLFADRFATWAEQGTVVAIEAAVELAQVVEGDARLSQRRELFAHGAVAQVAQRAIADALVWHCTQLFLDGLD